MKTIITNSAVTAASINPQYSVEAEFGSVLVKGSITTLAHHEVGRAEGYTLCPCLNNNVEDRLLDYSEGSPSPIANPVFPMVNDVCVISHLDWDTLGGILSLTGDKPSSAQFQMVWALIAFYDENGVHRAHEFTAINSLGREVANAMYAWLSLPSQRVFAPRDGGVLDVSEFVERVKDFLKDLVDEVDDRFIPCQGHDHNGSCMACDGSGIIGVNPTPILDAGIEWFESMKKLEAESYTTTYGIASGYSGGYGDWSDVSSLESAQVALSHCDNPSWMGLVLVRQSNSFVNHLYTHGKNTFPVVVGFNSQTGSITLSFEDEESRNGLSSCTIVQDFFPEVSFGWVKEDGSYHPVGEAASADDAMTNPLYVEGMTIRPLAGGHAGIAGSPRGYIKTLDDAKKLAVKVASLL